MLYVKLVLGHTMVSPVIGPGVSGVPGSTETASVLASLVPQELDAVTEIFPF